jgi:glycerol-3-phosphate acyltransferase PlsX
MTLFGGAMAPDRWSLVEAAGVVGDEVDALHAIRGRRDATCRVAARLVRDGAADAFVSAGPPSVSLAAASFGLGLLPGATHASLAATVHSGAGPFALVDVGAGTEADAAHLVLHAIHGSAYVATVSGVAAPRVALLAASHDAARLDGLRRDAYVALDALDSLTFVGPVTTPELLAGAPVDLVVTDGFTGSVLRAALDTRRAGVTGGVALLLGFQGAAVVATSDASAVENGLLLAAAAHRGGTVAATRHALASLIAHRRFAAGLPVAATW